MLLKTYAANFNKLLSQTLEEGAASEFVQDFLVQGQTVAQVCLPYGLYRKKLASNCTKICVEYSKMQETTQILAFQALRSVVVLYTPTNPNDKNQKKDTSLFEFAVKRMYNDFTKESKVGGGGFQV